MAAEMNMILNLVWDVVPTKHPKDLKTIIELNQGKLAEGIAEHSLGAKYLSTIEIEQLLSNEESWKVVGEENTERLKYLRFLIAFRCKEHQEMLDVTEIKKVITPEVLKMLLTKTLFQNLSIQEKQLNQLLNIQGYYLKCFINFHLKQDMRFKATIDSNMIDMDTPYTRTMIREENRKDPQLSNKYIKELDIEELTLFLFNNFFPDIAGIWADHTHEAPYLILQMVRICFEYGFYTASTAKRILKGLNKLTKSLLKLEEGWTDKLNDVDRLSDMIKANNIITQFAKCREHLASILIHIVVLLSDQFFMETYPEYVKMFKGTGLLHKRAGKTEAGRQAFMKEHLAEEFVFYNKEINDTVLFITMNYLSSIVYVGPLKSTTPGSRAAIERIFLYLSSTHRDLFLSSLKQIKQEDLKYLEDNDVVAPEVRSDCDDLGFGLRKLLILIGLGCFDSFQGAMIKNFVRDADYDKFLSPFVPTENPTLVNIITRILNYIEDKVRVNDDYKAGFAKESIPLALIALADYISEYFSPAVKVINRDIFSKLSVLCTNNNFCKSQLFKGDALFHFQKLLKRLDKEVYLFISGLCQEDNISFFLGREVLSSFLKIYEKFNKEISKKLRDGDGSVDSEQCSIFLVMTKSILKILKKPFLEERDKLQSAFLTQGIIFADLHQTYLPRMLELLQMPGAEVSGELEDFLAKRLFRDDSERELINVLEQQKELGAVNQKILMINVCFTVFRAFNVVTEDCYSSSVHQPMVQFIEPLKALVKSPEVVGTVQSFTQGKEKKRWIEPFGLDAEILTFLKNFEMMPEQNLLVEARIDLDSLPKIPFKEHLILVRHAIQRVNDYMSNSSLRKEGLGYLFEGMFPLLYKYVKSIKNLTNFDKYQLMGEHIEVLKGIMVDLNTSFKNFNSLVNKDVFEEEPFIGYNNAKDSKIGERGLSKKPSLTLFNLKKKGEADKANKRTDITSSRQYILASMCDNIVEFMRQYYEECEQDYMIIFRNMQDITEERFTELVYAAKFEEKTASEELAMKKNTLNHYIKAYQMTKEEYFERSEEPNLISYFDRNTQNLRGVFSSCLEKLLSRTKNERRCEMTRALSKDYSIERFWINPACYSYVSFLVKLLTKSKTARKEFYSFIREDRILKAILEEDQLGTKQDREGQALAYEKMMKSCDHRHRDEFLSVILRMHADMLVYLNSNSSLKLLWWVTRDTYEMISLFFKNLCECNFMEFKQFFADHEVSCKDEGWSVMGNSSIMEVFVKELSYVNMTCRISKNKEPVMTHSDQIEKIEPILGPLLGLVNESITGPCKDNQKTLLQTNIDGIINIALRVVDELGSDYFIIAEACMTLMLSLTEGYEEEVIKSLASKIPSSVLVDRLSRFTKKIYIKELIEAGKFVKLAMRSMEKSELADKEKLPEGTDSTTLPTPTNASPSTPGAEKKAVPAFMDLVLKAQGMQDIENKKYIVTEDMESMVTITDWEDLFELYIKRPDFSESSFFLFIFKIMILWQTLAAQSKSHKGRLDDAKYESELHFADKGLFGITLSQTKDDKKIMDQPPEFACIFYFISEKIMTEVEIVDPNKNPIKIYFPKAPPCNMLSQENKNAYREECDIDDSNTKMLNIMRNFNMFVIMMTSDLYIWRQIGFLFRFLSADAFQRYTFSCWVVGVILNFIISAGIIMDEYGENFMYRSDSFALASRIAGYILVCLSALFLFVWMIFKYKQTYRTRFEDYIFDHPGTSSTSLKARLYVMLIPAYLEQAFPMNYTLHIIFTVLGIELNIFFISLNLLLIINISRTCKFVITAIMLHADQLILTLVLAMFVIYTYSMVMGNILSDMIIPDVNQPCTSAATCFFFTMNLGLRNGGGVAESMKQVNLQNSMAERTMFDVTFFLLINVISLNIVFGIIIDTFSQLRDAQYERYNDTKNNCFVCGNTRLDFSKLGLNFDQHVDIQHDPWKYVYYIYYLFKKGESELSGVEYYAWTLYTQKKTNWIPIGNTMYIQSDTREQLKGLDDKIHSLCSRTEGLTNILGDLKKHTDDIMVARGIKHRNINQTGGESPTRHRISPGK